MTHKTIAAGLIAISMFAIPATATVPSGIVPPLCLNQVGLDTYLTCYLNDASNQTIANSILWVFPNLNDPSQMLLAWPQWPAAAKDELRQTFLKIVAWHNGGMTNYPGSLPPDPPPNVSEFQYVNG